MIKTAVQIKLGYEEKLVMGNLDSFRDWGHSRDYVQAMRKIMQHTQPDDFVVSTGITRSVRDLVELVFSLLDMNYLEYVTQDPKYMRPEELPYLKGDSSKIREILGWVPTTSFEEMITEMVQFWFDQLSKQ